MVMRLSGRSRSPAVADDHGDGKSSVGSDEHSSSDCKQRHSSIVEGANEVKEVMILARGLCLRLRHAGVQPDACQLQRTS